MQRLTALRQRPVYVSFSLRSLCPSGICGQADWLVSNNKDMSNLDDRILARLLRQGAREKYFLISFIITPLKETVVKITVF